MFNRRTFGPISRQPNVGWRPAVGSGAVGSGVGVCEAFFGPHAMAARTTKYLAFKRLFTRRNLSQRQSAVHHNHLSRDMSRCLAAQEDDHARNVFRFRNASEHRFMFGTLQNFARQLRRPMRPIKKIALIAGTPIPRIFASSRGRYLTHR